MIEDPLARAVRRKLKKMGILQGVPVAYSTEKPHHVKLLPLGKYIYILSSHVLDLTITCINRGRED